MARKDVLGRTGEQLAVDHLIDQGFEIIERNWRCRDGEMTCAYLVLQGTLIPALAGISALGWMHYFG